MIDLARALRIATDTGEVRFGVRQVRRSVRAKAAKLVVVASNCPEAAREGWKDARVHEFAGTNVELGAACGVPFPVAALAIVSPGESNILSL